MTEEKARFNCRIDRDLLEKYKECVPNASKDIREYMQRRVNQKSTIQELQAIRIDLITEIENLKIELDDIDAQIEELKLLRQDNALNKKKLMDAVEIVKRVSSSGNVEGVTVEKVEEIAENQEIKPYTLVNECKHQGIKFISKKLEAVNSTIRNESEEERPIEQPILNAMLRQYNKESIMYNNDSDRFLQDAKVINKYAEMCGNVGISFDVVAGRFKKLHPPSQADD